MPEVNGTSSELQRPKKIAPACVALRLLHRREKSCWIGMRICNRLESIGGGQGPYGCTATPSF
jgi:hypothetical protein